MNAQWYESNLLGGFGLGDHIIVSEQGQPMNYLSDAKINQLELIWGDISEHIKKSPKGGFLPVSVFSKGDVGWLYHYMEQSGLYYLRALNFDEVAPGIVYIRNLLFVSLAVLFALFLIMLIRLLIPYNRLQDALQYLGHDSDNTITKVARLVERQKESDFAKKIKSLREGLLPTDLAFPVLLIKTDEGVAEVFCREVLEVCPDAIAIQEGGGAIAAIPSCTVDRFNEIIRCLPERIEAKLYFSSLCYNAGQLRSSFSALEELKRLSFLYAEQLAMHEELLRECNTTSGIQVRKASALTGLLNEGQLQQAIKSWHGIFEDIRRDRFNGFCFAMNYIEKELNALGTEHGLESRSLSDDILSMLHSVSELHSYMEGRLEEIAEAAARFKREQLSGLVQRVDEYVLLHYADEALCAQKIADALEVSTTYLNQNFRKAAGISIGDAIHNIRIERACCLLKDTEHSVEMIAQQIGYPNTKYFFVVFKKLIGSTPNQFRKASSPS